MRLVIGLVHLQDPHYLVLVDAGNDTALRGADLKDPRAVHAGLTGQSPLHGGMGAAAKKETAVLSGKIASVPESAHGVVYGGRQVL